jgi:hypothetical protein
VAIVFVAVVLDDRDERIALIGHVPFLPSPGNGDFGPEPAVRNELLKRLGKFRLRQISFAIAVEIIITRRANSAYVAVDLASVMSSK